MRYLWSLTIVATILLCVACGEDDCYYCGMDVGSKGMIKDADVPVIPKDSDATGVVPDADNGSNGEDEQNADETVDVDMVLAENMVIVAAATYTMGCEENVDPNCAETSSTPHHEVSVLGFEIDVYEVTKKEYEACISAGICVNDTDNDIILHKIYDADNKFCVLQGPLHDTFPANCVSWLGARTYCEWVGKRLPTEAEWELAARGTDGRLYPWGDTPPPSCDNTSMDDSTGSETSWGCGAGSARPIGNFPAGQSPYGVFDMAGNMWEWVEDDYHANYDDPSRPDDGTAWVDAPRAPNRVMRGGSFMLTADENYEFLMYAHYGSPATSAGESRGFRCAR